MFCGDHGAGRRRQARRASDGAIDRDSAASKKFQNDFNAAGGRQFGSGWVFVTVAKTASSRSRPRPNQDSPIMDGKRALMGNDGLGASLLPQLPNRRA